MKIDLKVEQEFNNTYTKQAFQNIRTLTGQNLKPKLSAITIPNTFTKDLHNIYSRFDIADHSGICRSLLEAIPILKPVLPASFTEDVSQQLRKCKPGKAPGPDGIHACMPKDCTTKLSPVIHSLFSESYRTATVSVL